MFYFLYMRSLHIQALASPSGLLSLDNSQIMDSPILQTLASPTRARSPDVISSASTAMSQDMPEIASQALQLQRGLMSSLEPLPLSAFQTDSMVSAASALHLLTSPRTANRYADDQQWYCDYYCSAKLTKLRHFLSQSFSSGTWRCRWASEWGYRVWD